MLGGLRLIEGLLEGGGVLLRWVLFRIVIGVLNVLGVSTRRCERLTGALRAEATLDLRHSTFGKRESLFLVSQPFWDLDVGLGCVKADS